MVLRTLKLPSRMDSDLRTIAFVERSTKSDVIRLFVDMHKTSWPNIKTSNDDGEEEDEMVLRSLHLPSSLDDELRDVAHKRGCSKSALMRACIALGLVWYKDKTKNPQGEAEVRSALKAMQQ